MGRNAIDIKQIVWSDPNSELKGKLKKEKNLGTEVQLNTQIKQITDRIKAVKSEL